MTVYPNTFRKHVRCCLDFESEAKQAQELASKIFQECIDARYNNKNQKKGSQKIASMKELKENWYQNQGIYQKLLSHAEDFHIETCTPLLRLYMSGSLVEDVDRLIDGSVEHSSMETIVNDISWLFNHVDFDTI